MKQSKLSKLQKWILIRASQGPDKIGLQNMDGLKIARVIHEFYRIPIKRETLRYTNNFNVDVNKQRASVSRTFVSLLKRDLVNIFQGSAWTGITLTEQGRQTVKTVENLRGY